MKKTGVFALTLLLTVTTAFAVPAKRGVRNTLTLKDGTRVEATLMGDEHLHYYLTDDERAIQLIDDEYQVVDRSALQREHARRVDARNRARAARRIGTAPEGGYKGQKRGLVILVEFTDVKFTYNKATFENYFNKVGFNEYGMHGSVHDYFYEQSYGQFDLEFDIVGPITVNHTAYYYSADNKRVAAMVNDVCKEVDSQVNYRTYDWDNDGTVDQVYVIYAGYGAAQGATGTIWPHEYSVLASGSQYTTAEGKKIDTYGISCELMGASGSMIDGIGTSCHEFSHCLGLPDFYDTRDGGTNFGMNVWSLMDYGCYNGDNNGQCPSGYTAYERWFAGWLQPTELYSSQQVTDIPAIEDKPVAYVVYNDKTRDEYYLLANHQQKGFDSAQFGHGLLVLHVDYNANVWASNAVNSTTGRERMTIIPADNAREVSTSSLAGDPFPGTKKTTKLTDDSTPAAELFNANSAGTKRMGKPIADIDETKGLVTFNFMGGVSIEPPVSLAATNVDLAKGSFTANWQAYSGAKNYTVSLRQVIASDSPWDFQMLGENFEGFQSDYEGNTDLSKSSLDEYTYRAGWEGQNLYSSPHRLRVGKSGKPGRLVTPVIDPPTQGAISIMLTPISASVKAKGSLELRITLEDTTQVAAAGDITNIPIVGSEDEGITWLMGLESWPYGAFRVELISKGAGIFMNYLAIFDGYYAWDDFPRNSSAPGLNGQSRVKRITIDDFKWNTPDGKAPQVAAQPRKAKKETETSYDTKDTHYNFKDLEPATYYYKVRVTTDKGHSPWSEEQLVDLTNGIEEIMSEASDEQKKNGTDAIYDLSGRRISPLTSPFSPLKKGLYIRNGKTFVVK